MIIYKHFLELGKKNFKIRAIDILLYPSIAYCDKYMIKGEFVHCSKRFPYGCQYSAVNDKIPLTCTTILIYYTI